MLIMSILLLSCNGNYWKYIKPNSRLVKSVEVRKQNLLQNSSFSEKEKEEYLKFGEINLGTLDSFQEKSARIYDKLELSNSKLKQAEEHDYQEHKQKEKKEILAPCIDLNKGSLKELMGLKGIGAAKAQRIINRRNKKPFKKIRHLKQIKGIGQVTFNKNRPIICKI